MFLPLLFLVMLHPTLSAATCHPDEKSALLAIKNSLSNPPLWDHVDNCCEWSGVQCDEMTSNVINLNFLYYNSSCTISSNIGDLKHLRYLQFYKMPNLTGHIPREIQQLSNLTQLTISWTNISGPIPDFFRNLKNLNYLDLSNNRLSGSIPPSLSTFPSLNTIDLSRNQLVGSIPESFGNLNYSNLFLNNNLLSGDIPVSLANVNFDRLDISTNSLSGDASLFFGKRKSTYRINISRNNFEFNISKVRFMRRLVYLDMSHNKIYGNIPKQIVEAVFLLELNVSYNRLCGQIPNGWKLIFRSKINWDESSFSNNKCLCGTPLQPCKNKSRII